MRPNAWTLLLVAAGFAVATPLAQAPPPSASPTPPSLGRISHWRREAEPAPAPVPDPAPAPEGGDEDGKPAPVPPESPEVGTLASYWRRQDGRNGVPPKEDLSDWRRQELPPPKLDLSDWKRQKPHPPPPASYWKRDEKVSPESLDLSQWKRQKVRPPPEDFSYWKREPQEDEPGEEEGTIGIALSDWKRDADGDGEGEVDAQLSDWKRRAGGGQTSGSGSRSYWKRDAELEALTSILGSATYTEATQFEKCAQSAPWYAQCKGTGEGLVPCLCANETAVTGIDGCLTSTVGETRAGPLIAKFATSCSEIQNTVAPQPSQTTAPGNAGSSVAPKAGFFGLGLWFSLSIF